MHYLKQELYELIRKDEEILDFLQGSGLDGLWFWDLENIDHEWMSPKFWQVLGYDPEKQQHLSEEWQHIINQDDLLLARDNFEKHYHNPEHPYDQVVRYKHRNGSTVYIRCRGIAIRDENGVPVRMLGTHNDITEQKELENKYRRNLRELDRLYADIKLSYEESENLFEMAPDAIIKVEEDGTIIKANIQASNLFGYSKAELLKMRISDLMPVEHRHHHEKHMQHYFRNGGLRRMGNERGKLEAVKKNQELLAVEITLNLIDTRYGKRALATIRDVTDREALIEKLENKIQENNKLEQMTLTDPLTQLYNRRYFDEVISREFERSRRHAESLSLMIVDIDHFKQVNDKYGHEAGDIALKYIASLLRELVRYCDVVCRIGGEEFAVVLPNTDIESSMALADRICYEAADHKVVLTGKEFIKLTLSIGVTCLVDDDDEVTDIFSRADSALYHSKQQGRNRITSI